MAWNALFWITLKLLRFRYHKIFGLRKQLDFSFSLAIIKYPNKGNGMKEITKKEYIDIAGFEPVVTYYNYENQEWCVWVPLNF